MPDAVAERGAEIGLAPGANAIRLVGRDVRNVEAAEGRIETEAARRSRIALIAAVATAAAGRIEEILAAPDSSVIGGLRPLAPASSRRTRS